MSEEKLSMTPSQQTPDGQIRPSFLEIMTDDNAKAIAQHIVDVMRREADQEQLDFDFHISADSGQMNVTGQFLEKNVWFRFDTKPDSLLSKLKAVEFEADCNVDELDYMDDYHRTLCKAIKDRASDVEQILRDRMFGGKDVPVKLVEVTGFEMIDFSNVRPEENYTISIEKKVPKGEVDISPAVSQELFNIHFATGKGFNEIIRDKKAADDPNYKYVVGVTTSKFLWECQVDFFVDFSASEGLNKVFTRPVDENNLGTIS